MSRSPEEPTEGDRLHRRALIELPELALDSPVDPIIAAHVAGCADCQVELQSLRAVRDLARFGSVGGTARAGAAEPEALRPGPLVWDRISAELAAGPPVEPGRVEPDAGRRWSRRLPRRGLLAGLAAAAIVVAGVAGWTLGSRQGDSARARGQAVLAAQPGTVASAQGHAVMRPSHDGYQMTVTTTGLPAPTGYYEVWLYDPSAAKMVAIGTLGSDAQGSFTMPAGIDTQAYYVVDVSNQLYNGDPRHQTSVLRGTIRTG